MKRLSETLLCSSKGGRRIKARERVIEIAREAEYVIIPVTSDDEGDTYWKWKAEYRWAGEHIFDEYWHVKPNEVQVFNALFHSLHDGQLGIDMEERFLEREDKMDEMYIRKSEH